MESWKGGFAEWEGIGPIGGSGYGRAEEGERLEALESLVCGIRLIIGRHGGVRRVGGRGGGMVNAGNGILARQKHHHHDHHRTQLGSGMIFLRIDSLRD